MAKTRGTPRQRRRAEELLRLGREEFGRLLPGEVKMLRGAAMGKKVELSEPGDEELVWDAEKKEGSEWGCWETWGEHRKVRAVVLRWVCSLKDMNALVDPKGILLGHALIQKKLDLDGAAVPFRVGLFSCAIPDGMSVSDARLHVLALDGSAVSGFSGDRINVAGDVHFRNGFRALGEVRLLGATIGGDLDCFGGRFVRAGGIALCADGVNVAGDVRFDANFSALGEVRLLGATIKGNLIFGVGEFENQNGDAISLQQVSVNGAMFLKDMKVRAGVVDLSDAKTNYLIDNLIAWPKQVRLTGFRYSAILPDSIGSVEGRLEWLAKHDATCAKSDRFDPQPYRQLAKVLRHSGHDRFANEVMFEASKRQAAAQLKRLKEMDKSRIDIVFVVWYWLLERVIGYGYRRWLPLVWMIGFFAVGAVVFSDFDPLDVFRSADPYPGGMQPSQAKAAEAALQGKSWLEGYPVFRPIAYSMDTFLPLVDLHQEKYWTPKDGFVKRVYLPIHILMGWIVTTLAAVSVTGLVRHEKE